MNIEQLRAKIAEIREQIAALKAGEQTAENAAKLVELRAELKPLVPELEKLEAAFADDEHDAEPADGDAGDGEGEGGDAGDGAGDGEGGDAAPTTPATPGDGEGADGGDAGDGAGDAGDGAATKPVALAASAADVSPTAGGEGDAPKGPAPMALVASAGTAGVNAGSQLTRDDVLKVLQASHTAASRVTNGKVRMFEVQRWGGEVETPSDNRSTIDNTRIIMEARERHLKGENMRPAALVAGGCFCGPDELIRETGVVGERGRPVAGLFPSIPISGGFRAMPDIAFNVDNLGSVVQWTCDDQDAVDPGDSGTWKPCTEIDCFTEESFVPYAVVACTTASRFHRWAHPEQVDRHIDLLGIEYDSVAETLLLDKLEADAGTPLTIGAGETADLGMVAQVIYALSSLSFALGYEHREGSGVLDRYTLIAPVGFAEALYGDEKLRGFPSGVTSKAALISMIEDGSGIRIVERLDEPTSRKAAAAATVAALNAGGAIDDTSSPLLPPTFRLFLVDTSQWVHGEGTLVAADWHVDGDLRAQNRMQYFLENLEILERLGVKKTHIIDLPGQIKGTYSDLVAGPHTA